RSPASAVATSRVGQLVDPTIASVNRVGVPDPREGLVDRSRLVTLLLSSTASVVTVVAPPGYGKTTLLAQWAERLSDRVAWVSCEGADNDPVALWNAIIAAFGRLAPQGVLAADLPAQTGGGLEAVPALVAMLSRLGDRAVVMLDHVEAIRSRDSWAALSE